MSAQSNILEIKGWELAEWLAKNPCAILVIINPYDTNWDRLMEDMASSFPEAGVRWMANDPHVPPTIGEFQIDRRIAHQVVVFLRGQAVELITSALTLETLEPLIRDALATEG